MKKILIVALTIFSASLASAQSEAPKAASAVVASAENVCTPDTVTLRGENQPFVCSATKQWVPLNGGFTSVAVHSHAANLARTPVPVCPAGHSPVAQVIPDPVAVQADTTYSLKRVADSYVLHIHQLAGKTAHLTASVNTGCV